MAMSVPSDREAFIARYRFCGRGGVLCGPKVIRAAMLRALREHWATGLAVTQAERIAHVDRLMADDRWLRWRACQTPMAVGRDAVDLMTRDKFGFRGYD